MLMSVNELTHPLVHLPINLLFGIRFSLDLVTKGVTPSFTRRFLHSESAFGDGATRELGQELIYLSVLVTNLREQMQIYAPFRLMLLLVIFLLLEK